ncbi:beta-glucosidase [Erwinia amylovora MR1]|nr:beta-glucosidase [Erwinia amylovora MR1]
MQYPGLTPFPDDFLWGASTSAYQVEGAADRDGKGPSVIDKAQFDPRLSDFSVTSDHYHRFAEDVALFAELGLKTYRFPFRGAACSLRALASGMRKAWTSTSG